MLKTEIFILLPGLETNTYLVYDDDDKIALLIDPSAPSGELKDHIKELSIQIKYIVNTHGHMDHIGGNMYFHNHFQAPIGIHPEDADMLTNPKKNLSTFMGSDIKTKVQDFFLYHNDTLELGKHQIKVIHTPGHTPGSVCLLIENMLFSGDTLFEQSIGRTDFPRGSHAQIISSIKNKLMILPDNTVVYPGHGPHTSIGLERKINPFIR